MNRFTYTLGVKLLRQNNIIVSKNRLKDLLAKKAMEQYHVDAEGTADHNDFLPEKFVCEIKDMVLNEPINTLIIEND